MRRSIALTHELHEALCGHLVRPDGQEDLCFAVWFPSRGRTRETALLHSMIHPEPGDHAVHGNAEFYPQYFERAMTTAMSLGGGLAFMHSHPAAGWQAMSAPDATAESRMAPTVLAATGLPLVGLTLAARDSTWSARFWDRVGPRQYTSMWVESIRVVGRSLDFSFNDDLVPVPPISHRQERTVSAWGPQRQATLGRLQVGVVGVGNVGGIVAEGLARTGVRNLMVLDFDSVEDINLDRALLTTPEDIGKSKARVVGRRISGMGLLDSPSVDMYELSICEDEGYRRILDCDVIFSCVDRPWPRSVLNFVAYAHLIPVIDGGIRVSRTRSDYRGADWRAHTVTHEHACLKCLGQYDPGLVSAEQTGHLEDPRYIDTLPAEHPLRGNENVFAFGLALGSLELLQFIMLAVGPAGLGVPGAQICHLATGTIDIDGRGCDPDCDLPPLAALGESAGHPGTGRHEAAERARALRELQEARRGNRILRWVRSMLKQLTGANRGH